VHGIEARCHALGAERETVFDGLVWQAGAPEPAAFADVLVLDSYRVGLAEAGARVRGTTGAVVFHDAGEPPEGAAIVVAAGAGAAGPAVLAGLEHACLRPAFWGLPARAQRDQVKSVLVALGSGGAGGVARATRAAIAHVLPHAAIDIVPRPGGSALQTADDVLEALLQADIAVLAAGQAMLEAAATGTPSVLLCTAENQRAQADMLLARCAAVEAQPDSPDGIAAALESLVRPATRAEIAATGQAAVDGYGALRVAFQIARLIASRGSRERAQSGT
jgi:spore coat polysaccharide biosynthesis predicted glycosyltransferase SpsG